MRAPFLLVLATTMLLAPAAARAQLRVSPRPDLSDAATRACVAALPAVDFSPTLVSLGARSALPRDSGAVQALFILAQDVATRMREQIGAAPGLVPTVDSILPWTAVWGWLDGELHLDGSVTITPQVLRTVADSMARDGDALIDRALRSLIAEGESWPFQTGEWTLAVPFTLFFAAPEATADNTTLRTWRSVAIPVFQRALPQYAPVRWSREPAGSAMLGAVDRDGMVPDSLTLRFRYDETGKVERRSVREIPYREESMGIAFTFGRRYGREPKSVGERAKARASFVRMMTGALRHTNWTDGRIGSCALPREAQQSFRVRVGGLSPAMRAPDPTAPRARPDPHTPR